MTRVALVFLLAGCGFRIPAGSSNGDGGTDDDAGTDATVDDGDVPTDGLADAMPDGMLTPTCTLAWLNRTITFGTPTALSSLSSTSYDRDPTLSDDERTIWYSNGGANSQGGGDVFRATRSAIGQPFGVPVRDTSFSTSGGAESKISITENGLYAVVASSQGGGAGGTDIWQSTRGNTGAAWGALSRMHTMGLATTNSELDPFVTPDGLSIYYAPTSTTGPQRIVVAKRANTNAAFANVTDVTPLNGGLSGNFDPVVFANERVVVFASSRITNGAAADNIYYAVRASAGAAFDTPTLVPGVNSDFDDGDPHISSDGCRIYFSRRVGGGVDWELYTASSQ
jgi:hypothetical protein